jgi:hypothetical protein
LEYIFTLQQPYHNAAIVKKDYKRLDLMVVYLWNFFNKIFNFFSSYEVHIRFFLTFVNTLCYNNDEDCDLFKL